jgi:nicotinamide riboside kinase
MEEHLNQEFLNIEIKMLNEFKEKTKNISSKDFENELEKLIEDMEEWLNEEI